MRYNKCTIQREGVLNQFPLSCTVNERLGSNPYFSHFYATESLWLSKGLSQPSLKENVREGLLLFWVNQGKPLQLLILLYLSIRMSDIFYRISLGHNEILSVHLPCILLNGTCLLSLSEVFRYNSRGGLRNGVTPISIFGKSMGNGLHME